MIEKLLLPLGLAFIMASMGLSLQLRDFRAVFVKPSALMLGLLFQVILLPASAFALLILWPLPPVMAVGIMILAACPGGITSNLLTHFARGDTALSISLTAISSIAGVVSVPLVVNLALIYFMGEAQFHDLPVWKMMAGVFLVSTLPVILGMALHHWRPNTAHALARFSAPASTVIFILIVIGAFANQWDVMIDNLEVIGPLIIALNGGIMSLSYLVARIAGFQRRQVIAISIESGLQNGALGIFVAVTLLGNAGLMVPSITYALVMNVSAAIFIAVMLWQGAKR
jgi:BASS family bile acid:Na+ symporter